MKAPISPFRGGCQEEAHPAFHGVGVRLFVMYRVSVGGQAPYQSGTSHWSQNSSSGGWPL